MKRCKTVESELPDCVISYIFTKLSLKDSVKTSILSKRWIHDCRLRNHLNFDLDNMFDYNTIQELPKSVPLFQSFQSEFATRMDQFMLQHQGAMICSLRVHFPLGNEHSDVIDRMISKGIAKGAKRIELLFSYEASDFFIFKIKPYKFSFTLLSHTDSDSLTYLYLQNCRVVAPMEFSGLKNLRTLVLHQVTVKQVMLQGLFSNCIHLLDFTLNDCKFRSDLKIISQSLFHLNIYCGVNIQRRRNIDIIASNLSSFEYYYINDDYGEHTMNIKAHMLSKFCYRGINFYKPIGFSGLKNVTTIVLDGLHDYVTPLLFSECPQLEDVTFKNCWIKCDLNIVNPKLRHLKIIDFGYKQMYPENINIDALNLSSFEYSGYAVARSFSVKAPRLVKVFWNVVKRDKIKSYPRFRPITKLHHIENLAMVLEPSQIAKVSRVLVRFQNLRRLELFIEGAYDSNMDYFWILDVVMASRHLQKLSLTIRNPHMESSHMAAFQRQRREYSGFSHNNLKYVELCGSVCTINVIELASHLLRNVNSLKQITFNSRDKFYLGAGRWTKDSNSCLWFDHNFIHEMLKDEVNDQCQLIIV